MAKQWNVSGVDIRNNLKLRFSTGAATSSHGGISEARRTVDSLTQ
jgi:hypothetical protein